MTTARPPWAVTAWCDTRYVYVEFPVKGSIPFVMKFALSEAGLSKALWLLRERHEAGHPLRMEKDTHPRINRPKPIATEAQRVTVLSILKKNGLV